MANEQKRLEMQQAEFHRNSLKLPRSEISNLSCSRSQMKWKTNFERGGLGVNTWRHGVRLIWHHLYAEKEIFLNSIDNLVRNRVNFRVVIGNKPSPLFAGAHCNQGLNLLLFRNMSRHTERRKVSLRSICAWFRRIKSNNLNLVRKPKATWKHHR